MKTSNQLGLLAFGIVITYITLSLVIPKVVQWREERNANRLIEQQQKVEVEQQKLIAEDTKEKIKVTMKQFKELSYLYPNDWEQSIHRVDGWGNPITTTVNGDLVVFRSSGPDKIFYTSDDLFQENHIRKHFRLLGK